MNRLDYGTSGLVIFAKSAASQEALSKAIQSHQIVRLYYAVVRGIPPTPTGIINFPIADIRGRRVVAADGQPAETRYRIVESLPGHSLLELNLITGRTHQIRVHLSHAGLPILGDPQYGVGNPLIQRTALHAGKLNFAASPFPIPELEAPFPEDLRRLLAALGGTSAPPEV